MRSNEEHCIEYRWVRIPADEVDQAHSDALLTITLIYNETPELAGQLPLDDCPVDPADDLPVGLLGDVVRETLIDALPRPEPHVPPGYALTGMPAYLVTDHELEYGPTDHAVDLEIMDLTVRVTGTATSTVDWGDGSEPRTYEQAGLPHPDGEIRHTYRDRGFADIAITDTWHLTYDVHDAAGNVIITDAIDVTLDTVSLEEPLEIRELRAVRTTPDAAG